MITRRTDPCGKLIRLQENGAYVVKSGELLHWPTGEEMLVKQEAIRRKKFFDYNKLEVKKL